MHYMINCENLGSFVYFLFAGTYGTIEFSMSYDEAEEHLVINVVKAKVREQVVGKMMGIENALRFFIRNRILSQAQFLDVTVTSLL